MDELAVDDSKDFLKARLLPGAQDGADPQRLSLLNALLMVSLEDVLLERQLLSVLDLLLADRSLPLQPQAAVYLVTEDPNLLEIAASRGMPDAARAMPAQVAHAHCVCERPGASGEPGFIACAADGHREVHYVGAPESGRHAIPLHQQGTLLGLLVVFLKDYLCEADNAKFLAVVATLLTGIIVRSQATQHTQRLLSENRQLNRRLIALQEEEYRHLARELHDEIGQSIAAIKTEAALLPHTRMGEELKRSARTISTAADRIYEAMHEKIRRLRPAAFDDLGLLAAIEAHIAEWQRQRPAVPCVLDVRGRLDDLDEAMKITVYRFVQECLTNAIRHAAASEVRVSLAREDLAIDERSRGTLLVCVSDDGRGADVTRLRERNGRFGLLAMRERVEGLGGCLKIEGAPGQGFKVTASLPLADRRRRT